MGKKILVVDDDAMNLKMAELLLGKKDYQVKSVNSGRAALDLLEEEPVDLVLLDVEMPEMNGIETLEAIRAKQKFAQLPVLFLSADEEIQEAVEGGQYAVQGFIGKPIPPQVLYERVEEHLK